MRVQARRTDAFPTTWELPVGITLTWLVGVFLTMPLGQGVAFMAVGEGYVWPGQNLGPSILGLLTGEPGRGLPRQVRMVAPPTSLIYAAVIFMEFALTAAAVLGLSWWWRTVGPFAQFGMAARQEVASVLGRGQLRRRRHTIRPDLTGGERP
jgi:hypothetical protein